LSLGETGPERSTQFADSPARAGISSATAQFGKMGFREATRNLLRGAGGPGFIEGCCADPA
jgi:hypothetical protein